MIHRFDITAPARTRGRSLAVVLAATAALATACPAPPPTAPSPLLSLGNGATVGDAAATGGTSSANGRFTAFTSWASNLVPADTNASPDVFVRDRQAGTTVRIAEGSFTTPRISENGRYVGFRNVHGAFSVYDRSTAATTTWSDLPGSASPTAPLLTDDGLFAVYGVPSSFGIFSTACRVRNMTTGVASECPSGFGTSGVGALGAISANGRFVIYSFNDFNGGPTGWRIWDRTTDTVTMMPTAYLPYFSIAGVSDDGRYVTTLVPTVAGSPATAGRLDLTTSAVQPLPGTFADWVIATSISPDGRYVGVISQADDLAPGDDNGVGDVFVWDTATDALRWASQLPGGGPAATASSVCLAGGGQVLDDGTTCVMTGAALAVADTNGVDDLYRL